MFEDIVSACPSEAALPRRASHPGCVGFQLPGGRGGRAGLEGSEGKDLQVWGTVICLGELCVLFEWSQHSLLDLEAVGGGTRIGGV